jgi:hypothetical protein
MDSSARPDGRDGPVQAFRRDAAQSLGLGSYGRDGHAEGRVAEVPSEVYAAVYPDNVARQNPALAWDTVDDFLVYGYAQRSGERIGFISVVEERGLPSVIADEFLGEAVKVDGSDAFYYQRPQFRVHPGQQRARRPYAGQLSLIL